MDDSLQTKWNKHNLLPNCSLNKLFILSNSTETGFRRHTGLAVKNVQSEDLKDVCFGTVQPRNLTSAALSEA